VGRVDVAAGCDFVALYAECGWESGQIGASSVQG
jgi:hypothetical protein